MTRNFSLILGGCIQCTYLVGSAIPVLLMDRFGRRLLLMHCSIGLCFCFVMVTILLAVGTRRCAYGATAFIFLFQLFYGVGWLPVPWFYPSEINTTRIRTRMQAIASGWNWMAVFSVVKIAPIAFSEYIGRLRSSLWCSLDSSKILTYLDQTISDGAHSSSLRFSTQPLFP